MRFVWLFLRARTVGHAAVGIVAVAGGTLFWDKWFGADEVLLLAGATLCPLAAAALIGVTTHSPLGELERTASRGLGSFRFGLMVGLLLLAIAFLLPAAWNWPGAGEDWMLVRNLAGFVGLTLTSAATVGARFSWVLPVALGMSTFFVNINVDGPSRWAWTARPHDDGLSLAIALALLVSGLAAVTWHGARDTADEAG